MANEINDYLVRETGRIAPDINQKMKAKMTPWLSLFAREAWQEGMGVTGKTFVWDRVQLKDPVKDWANMSDAPDVANGGSCVPPADEVIFTQQNREYNLQQKAIWGPRICVNNLRYTFMRNEQINATIKALADQARETWITRYRSEYTRIAGNKALANSSFALNNDGYNNFEFPSPGGTPAVSVLTSGLLDMCYEYLNHQGAQEGCLGMAETLPVYGLITSARNSRNVIRENAKIREDFRYSKENEKLLGPLGIKLQYNGFSHLIDDKLPRWNWQAATAATGAVTGSGATRTLTLSASSALTVGSLVYISTNMYIVTVVTSGTVYTVVSETLEAPTNITATVYSAWVSVPEYVISSGVEIPNPAWLQAGYEDVYIFHQKAATCLIPKPITAVGGAKFDPVNYAGEFSWKNYTDELLNPDGTIGRFRGVLSSGTRADNPEYAIVMRVKSCPNAFGLITDCTTLGSPA